MNKCVVCFHFCLYLYIIGCSHCSPEFRCIVCFWLLSFYFHCTESNNLVLGCIFALLLFYFFYCFIFHIIIFYSNGCFLIPVHLIVPISLPSSVFQDNVLKYFHNLAMSDASKQTVNHTDKHFCIYKVLFIRVLIYDAFLFLFTNLNCKSPLFDFNLWLIKIQRVLIVIQNNTS